VRTYAREAAGIPALPGSCRWERDGERLVSTLTVDGEPVIRTTARVTENAQGTLGGHLNYYARRQLPAPVGGTSMVDELIELPLPFVANLYEASVEDVEFRFPEGTPQGRLAPVQPLEVGSVLYGDVTFTYSMGRQILDYLQEV
jgi:hypothetical protein